MGRVADTYYQRHNRSRDLAPSRWPRLELALTIIVLIAVIATVIIFLFVLHDVPFRASGPVG